LVKLELHNRPHRAILNKGIQFQSVLDLCLVDVINEDVNYCLYPKALQIDFISLFINGLSEFSSRIEELKKTHQNQWR